MRIEIYESTSKIFLMPINEFLSPQKMKTVNFSPNWHEAPEKFDIYGFRCNVKIDRSNWREALKFFHRSFLR